MEKRKSVRVVLFTMCFLMIFVIKTTAAVNAANGDTITLGRGITTANTPYERKINNSSVYAKCLSAWYESTSSIKSCKGIVQGSNGNSSSSAGNPGQSLTYTFFAGSEHDMINSVYENGYSFARIHFRGDINSFYTTFTFNWGPMS